MKKILILDTVYHQALRDFEKAIPAFGSYSYSSEISKFFDFRFGTSDVYSYHLNNLGYSAKTLIVNSTFFQNLWVKEFLEESKMHALGDLMLYSTKIPILGKYFQNFSPLHSILLSQVKYYKPDILYIQDLNFINNDLLLKFKKMGILLIGQIASPLPNLYNLKHYDHIYSSLPNLIEDLSASRISSSFLPIGFDERVLHKIVTKKKTTLISFVGGISSIHSSTLPLLEVINKEYKELVIYGYGKNQIKRNRDLKSKHRGNAWGLDMYKIIAQSFITLNRHSDVSGLYANNMRLFEATGVGTLLLTDKKSNLEDYFKIDTEILVYEDPQDAKEKISWILQNLEKAEEVSLEGQKRTLQHHTYKQIIGNLSLQLKKLI